MKYTEEYIPDWCLPIIINDDFTGVNESEEVLIKAFLDEMSQDLGPGPLVFEPIGEPEYASHNAVHPLGDTVRLTRITSIESH